MNFLKKNGGYLIVGLLVASVVYGAYSYFGGTTPPEAPLTSHNNLNGAPEVGTDLLAILLSLNSLSLDPTVFGDTTFRALKDFGLPIPEEAIGRNNPFAPLGEGSR